MNEWLKEIKVWMAEYALSNQTKRRCKSRARSLCWIFLFFFVTWLSLLEMDSRLWRTWTDQLELWGCGGGSEHPTFIIFPHRDQRYLKFKKCFSQTSRFRLEMGSIVFYDNSECRIHKLHAMSFSQKDGSRAWKLMILKPAAWKKSRGDEWSRLRLREGCNGDVTSIVKV